MTSHTLFRLRLVVRTACANTCACAHVHCDYKKNKKQNTKKQRKRETTACKTSTHGYLMIDYRHRYQYDINNKQTSRPVGQMGWRGIQTVGWESLRASQFDFVVIQRVYDTIWKTFTDPSRCTLVNLCDSRCSCLGQEMFFSSSFSCKRVIWRLTLPNYFSLVTPSALCRDYQ